MVKSETVRAFIYWTKRSNQIASRSGCTRGRQGDQVTTIKQLTAREREILELIGHGLSTREIAEQLHRSIKTVQTHRLALGRKLGVRNRVQLARLAIQAGLVPLNADPESAEKPVEENALRSPSRHRLLERMLSETSWANFFKCLLSGLVEGLEEGWALIAEHDRPVPGQWRVVRSHPALPVTTTQPLPMADSLCQLAVDEQAVALPDTCHQRLPKDVLVQRVAAEAAFLVPLADARGRILGTLAVISTKPVRDPELLSVMSRFAPRAGIELEEYLARQSLRHVLGKVYGHPDLAQMNIAALCQLVAEELGCLQAAARDPGCGSRAHAPITLSSSGEIRGGPSPKAAGEPLRALEDAEEMVVRVDHHARLAFVNAAVCRQLGKSCSELVTRPVSQFGWSAPTDAAWHEAVRFVLETGKPHEFQFAVSRGETTRRFEAALTPQRLEGATMVSHVLAVVRQIAPPHVPSASQNT